MVDILLILDEMIAAMNAVDQAILLGNVASAEVEVADAHAAHGMHSVLS